MQRAPTGHKADTYRDHVLVDFFTEPKADIIAAHDSRQSFVKRQFRLTSRASGMPADLLGIGERTVGSATVGFVARGRPCSARSTVVLRRSGLPFRAEAAVMR